MKTRTLIKIAATAAGTVVALWIAAGAIVAFDDPEARVWHGNYADAQYLSHAGIGE